MLGTFKKCFYSLFMLTVLAAMAVNIANLTLTYLTYQTQVQMSIVSANSLTFPVVAICNMNPVRNSAWQRFNARRNDPVPSVTLKPSADFSHDHKRRKRSKWLIESLL
jgi:hypothetical protein